MKRTAGYTLIEVLVMLAVTALLAATVLETVRASTANGVRIEQAARNASQDYVTLASVRRAIEGTRPDYTNREDRFAGDSREFRAMTSFPITTSRPGLRPYTLRLVNGTDGVRLIYEEPGAEFEVQYWPGAEGHWSYFGEETVSRPGFMPRPGETDARIWTSQWPAPQPLGARVQTRYYQALPLAVRAEITLADGRRDVMVLHLPITAPPPLRLEDVLGSLPQ
ncbi:type II secretion system protein [Oceanicaulis sp. LC35]|uniref:type II secretion system protein n=1 Tax=Oceanicaulis sp. LC35 TaxID=3349635 RepID=UPI003F861B5F